MSPTCASVEPPLAPPLHRTAASQQDRSTAKILPARFSRFSPTLTHFSVCYPLYGATAYSHRMRAYSYTFYVTRLRLENTLLLAYTLHTSRRFLPELKDGGALFGGIVLPSVMAKGRYVRSSHAKQKVSHGDGWEQQSDTETLVALADALNRTCKWFRLEQCGGMVMFCGYK